MDEADERARRRAARRNWPVRVLRLGEDTHDLSATTTPEERWAMMWPLALDAWAAAGLPIPDYPRHEAPVRVRWLHES